jgi:ubiquinone/menaquinone biosynthesis C-methylase UbiE
LFFLRERGYGVAGIDQNAILAKQLRDEFGLETYAGLLSEAALPGASFDAVTLWWVLEHTHDPIDVLKEAHRILRPGASVVVAVQNFASLGRLLFGEYWHHLDLPGHLYQFEPETLLASLSATGFRPVRLRYDLLAKDIAPSIGYRLGLKKSLDWWLPNILALPVDLLGSLLRRSCLITAYATRL